MRYWEIIAPRAEADTDVAEGDASLLNEGRRKWINASKGEMIGVDPAHVDGQQVHAHLPNGRAVNIDGSVSHGGEPFYMERSWIDALKRFDFNIQKSRLVEGEDVGPAKYYALERELVEFLKALRKQLDAEIGE